MKICNDWLRIKQKIYIEHYLGQTENDKIFYLRVFKIKLRAW